MKEKNPLRVCIGCGRQDTRSKSQICAECLAAAGDHVQRNRREEPYDKEMYWRDASLAEQDGDRRSEAYMLGLDRDDQDDA